MSSQVRSTIVEQLHTPFTIPLFWISVGFMVSFSLSGDEDRDYREHVLHFDTTGTIQAILPFMAHGPRDFFSVELSENKEIQGQGDCVGKPGWYMYLNDGHGGIMCVYLGDAP